MASDWASSFTRWSPHVAEDGQSYNLTHLHPHRMQIELTARLGYPAQTIEVRVGYSSHTFTKSCPEEDSPHHQYSKPHDLRVFCNERYQHSLQLRAIMESIEGRRCYATNHKNYFIIENSPSLSLSAGTEYWVFFDTRKAGPAALRLFIESAYAGEKARAPRGRSREAIGFRALASKTLDLQKANPAT